MITVLDESTLNNLFLLGLLYLSLKSVFSERFKEVSSYVDGLRTSNEELINEKSRLQLNFDQLSDEVDSRIDKLKVYFYHIL